MEIVGHQLTREDFPQSYFSLSALDGKSEGSSYGFDALLRIRTWRERVVCLEFLRVYILSRARQRHALLRDYPAFSRPRTLRCLLRVMRSLWMDPRAVKAFFSPSWSCSTIGIQKNILSLSLSLSLSLCLKSACLSRRVPFRFFFRPLRNNTFRIIFLNADENAK